MKTLIALIFLFYSTHAFTLERKPIEDVTVKEITEETQEQADSEDGHLSLAWWVPYEYWASVLSRDKSIANALKDEMLNILDDYSIIALVQADISPLGVFNFYSKNDVQKYLQVKYSSPGKKDAYLAPLSQVPDDMNILLSQVTPVLKAAMGNLGANFHFFVYSDRAQSGDRIMNPYLKGELTVSFKSQDGRPQQVRFKTPLNSLYEPRICPNGEEAHISWNYCPWSGEKL